VASADAAPPKLAGSKTVAEDVAGDGYASDEGAEISISNMHTNKGNTKSTQQTNTKDNK
jgi:hypothetical protein